MAALFRRGSEAARLLGLWVRIPPGAWMSVCCDCFVLLGRGLIYSVFVKYLRKNGNTMRQYTSSL